VPVGVAVLFVAADHLTRGDDTSIQTTAETPGQLFSGTFNAAGTLGTFNNSSANGNWTLFFADTTPGGGQAQLTGWSLDITVVPEPVNVALGCFVTMLLAMAGVRRVWRTKAVLPITNVEEPRILISVSAALHSGCRQVLGFSREPASAVGSLRFVSR
jgi:hypothetical protein